MRTNIPTPNRKLLSASEDGGNCEIYIEGGTIAHVWLQAGALAIGGARKGIGLFSLEQREDGCGPRIARCLTHIRLSDDGMWRHVKGKPDGFNDARDAYLSLCLQAAEIAHNTKEGQAFLRFSEMERVRFGMCDEIAARRDSFIDEPGRCWQSLHMTDGPVRVSVRRLLFRYFDNMLSGSHAVCDGLTNTGDSIRFEINRAVTTAIQEGNGWKAVDGEMDRGRLLLIPKPAGDMNDDEDGPFSSPDYAGAAAVIFDRLRAIVSQNMSGHEKLAALPHFDRIAKEWSGNEILAKRFYPRLQA